MTNLKLIAAAALTAFAGSITAAPAEETGAAATASAGAVAVQACAAANRYGPVKLASVVPDGVGDWIVWLQDKDSDLWMCNANDAGSVYANVLIEGDLLRGEGARMAAVEPAAGTATDAAPARAERLCTSIGAMVEDMTVVTTVADGMGDYVVWMKTGGDSYWMCNASADAKLYVFEKIQYPISGAGADGTPVAPARIA